MDEDELEHLSPEERARLRLEGAPGEPLELEMLDGRVVRVNWPTAGRVTIRHPDGRFEEMSVAEYKALP
jgi:hypothetical protein